MRLDLVALEQRGLERGGGGGDPQVAGLGEQLERAVGDATVLANREKTYWRLLRKIKKADAPSERADRLLRLLEQAGASDACALKLVRPIERRHYGLVLGLA